MKNWFLKPPWVTANSAFQQDVTLTLSEPAVPFAEVYNKSTAAFGDESTGLVQKEILRTGYWPVLPTRAGLVKKPLTIVRDGKSDRDKGIIALAELVENFNKLDYRVQIPLAESADDHKNATRENTGFVEDIWIVDGQDGSKLVAKMNFTEDDVKEKVLRGTYADVSCGIPFKFASRGEEFGAVLEHVCITNRPFISGLGEFIALAEPEREVEVDHYVAPSSVVETPPETKIVDPFGGLSFKEISAAVKDLPELTGFIVEDIKAEGLVVKHESGLVWVVPFNVEDGKVVPKTDGWKYIKTEEAPAPEAVADVVPPPAPSQDPPKPEKKETAKPESSDPLDRELEAARITRQARFGAVAASMNPTKEAHMPLTREELEALNLADMPDGQKAAFQKLLDENSSLAATSREGEVANRIVELSDMGFKEKPGALKLYRQVALGDDGGPAVVVLSDDGKKESKTALAILDEFIAALKGEEDKVTFSDQAALVPGDEKPPETPEGETKTVEERAQAARAALGLIQS